MSLLSVSADAKTRKGEAHGYLTGVMYLAPHTIAGIGNLCPNASPGCIAACLNTAGRGVFNSVQQGRIKRAQAFKADRPAFMAALVREIAALVRKAQKLGLTPLVRLNGTSDLPWENMAVDGVRNLMTMFSEVQFYDYTKSVRRMLAFCNGEMPKNYHLTFSRSERNDSDCARVLQAGGNVAAVFSTKKGEALPTSYGFPTDPHTITAFPVIDGDVNDARPGDTPGGVVVGLRAKGRARKDCSGFVVAV